MTRAGPAARPAADELRWIEPADAVAMRELFAAVFGHALSPELQAWKYSHGVGLGLWRDGRLLAHYGGWTRDLLTGGKPLRGCEVCDVMVSPQARASLARSGPMQRLTARFLEQQIGFGLPHDVGFGFPTRRHFVLAERLGLYEAVDRLEALHWTPLRWASVAARRIDPEQLASGSDDWRDLEAVWSGMQAALGADTVIGVRDPAWLQYRYGRKPDHRYVLALLHSRWRKRPLGAVVWREHADYLELIDLVSPPEHFGALIDLARGQAARSGVGRVTAWVTASHADWLLQGSEPVSREPMDVIIPANAHSPGIPPADLRDRWFLMGGDTDFR